MMTILSHVASAARMLFFSAFLAALPTAAFAADINKGRSLYLIHCSGCHGAKGVSVVQQAPNFAYGESLAQPDPVLADVIRSGKDAMPPFIGILDNREILDVIAYIRVLL